MKQNTFMLGLLALLYIAFSSYHLYKLSKLVWNLGDKVDDETKTVIKTTIANTVLSIAAVFFLIITTKSTNDYILMLIIVVVALQGKYTMNVGFLMNRTKIYDDDKTNIKMLLAMTVLLFLSVCYLLVVKVLVKPEEGAVARFSSLSEWYKQDYKHKYNINKCVNAACSKTPSQQCREYSKPYCEQQENYKNTLIHKRKLEKERWMAEARRHYEQEQLQALKQRGIVNVRKIGEFLRRNKPVKKVQLPELPKNSTDKVKKHILQMRQEHRNKMNQYILDQNRRELERRASREPWYIRLHRKMMMFKR